MPDIETKTWRDKSGWGEGLWQKEPDRADWHDDETDLPCMAIRNRMGAWCGYVGVTRDHPWYGKDYDDLPAHLDVHGGLTYAAPCWTEDQIEEAGVEKHEVVCHVPRPGEDDDVFWFGFDCGHAFDLMPEMAMRERSYGIPPTEGYRETYRHLGYVIEEVTGLAHQIAAAEVAGETSA